MPFVFLSYELSAELSGYGNGDRVKIEHIRSIARGDSSNNSYLNLPGHFGTHIDFPKHFIENGKIGSDYSAEDFVFNQISFIDLQSQKVDDYLLRPVHFQELTPDDSTTLLIIKTGFCLIRKTEDYWLKNWGFAPETAAFLKEKFPQLKAILFDLMSLTSYQERLVGREAHRSFLGEHDLLLIEDADLSQVDENTKWNQVIVAPLRFENSDGTPVTIIANIHA